MFLAECTRPAAALRGVGPVLQARLARLGIHTVADVLRHLPRDYQDRRRRDLVAEAAGRERANVLVRGRGGRVAESAPPSHLQGAGRG